MQEPGASGEEAGAAAGSPSPSQIAGPSSGPPLRLGDVWFVHWEAAAAYDETRKATGAVNRMRFNTDSDNTKAHPNLLLHIWSTGPTPAADTVEGRTEHPREGEPNWRFSYERRLLAVPRDIAGLNGYRTHFYFHERRYHPDVEPATLYYRNPATGAGGDRYGNLIGRRVRGADDGLPIISSDVERRWLDELLAVLQECSKSEAWAYMPLATWTHVAKRVHQGLPPEEPDAR